MTSVDSLAMSALSLFVLTGCDQRCDDLRSAVAAGDRTRFEQLATGGGITCTDSDDWTLLHVAARSGRTELAALLLDRGAAIDARGAVGRTPIYEAAKYGRLATVQLLAERGAHIDEASDHGFTPMMVAAERNHLAIVRYLFERGAAAGAVNDVGKTALHQYIEHSAPDAEELPRLLIERGVPLEVHDVVGATALYSASQRGRVRIVRVLLEAGANPNATYRRGFTPLDVARRQGHDAIAALLIEHGGRTGGRAAYAGAVQPLPAQITRAGEVLRSSGPGAVPVGTRCSITARPAEGSRFNCQLDATCSGRRLYGGGQTGFTMCEPTANGARAFDPFGTDDDSDPSAELDTDRLVFLADDGLAGVQGTSVTVRLDAPAR